MEAVLEEGWVFLLKGAFLVIDLGTCKKRLIQGGTEFFREVRRVAIEGFVKVEMVVLIVRQSRHRKLIDGAESSADRH